MNELAGRRVVVTGAASGIGAAASALLRTHGATVVGVDLADADVDEAHRCDLSDPDAMDELVAALADPIDGLCNSAGLPTTRPPDQILAVNFLGLRHLTDALLPRLTVGSGVVNVASCAGTGWPDRRAEIDQLLDTATIAEGLAWFATRGGDALEAYRLSKEAVTVYTKTQALRHRDRDIRVNAVSPGAVHTPILDEFYATMDADRLADLREQAGGRDGRPTEIAGPIAFLLSPSASWVNGANLIVDGGAEAAVELGLV